MADDDEQEKPAAAGSAEQKKAGMAGPIAALALTMLLGIGLGMLILRMLSPPEATAEEQEQQREIALDEEAALEKTEEILFQDVIANLKGEVGRYVKVTVGVWFDKMDPDFPKILDERVQRLLQEQMIEELRSYDQKQLADEFVLEQIRKGFMDRMDRELRRVLHTGSEKNYVKRIVMSDIILQ
ncbi:MAG: hypothetical protein ACOCXA_07590 [Planctomycetota bacterium]